ncbi:MULTISPECIES: MarR family winged helix-turn-helix transcriptional regulator [Gordonia]|uniref:MarR family transcriptional regulator n=1 Tax=Gordonia hankookensis TaxID=589403 RepID=A0ABR7WE03_9ACTN|nr:MULTISPECIES: MarR family transcriptional regulator [Gordonia]MBD1321011.1 MarR family transcriptional regulator [Gordonia hankookensis]NDZ96583.1 MarR family transcriptional regulator [Streptomyces sp. SID11726]NEB23399.1 MarR family transcriptional regulator [Streptomyces sp. SID6673]WAC54727.1 MarR family transcriptional regulator [Gordonia sp. SL306]
MTEGTDQDALAAAWHDLSVRYHRVSCALDRELQANHKISASEFEVLELLWAADEHSLRMSELAEHVHLSQSALSRVVARLEKDGLASRTMCESDRRSVFAQLTESGEDRYRRARPTQRAVLADHSLGCRELLQRQS